MANLVLAFAELLGGAVILDAAIKGDTVANVIAGKATQHAIDGTPGGGTSSPTSSTGAGLPAGTYTNPVPGAKPGRLDQGEDPTLSGQGFVAPGKSKILIADQSNSGWLGGGYIAAQLLDGPLAGSVYYVAEGIAPIVKVGDIVAAGAALGHGVSNPYNGIVGNIEAGWADPHSPGRPLAQSLPGYSGDQSAAALTAGYSWSRFVEALGGAAGVFEGAGAAIAGTIRKEFSGSHHPSGVPY